MNVHRLEHIPSKGRVWRRSISLRGMLEKLDGNLCVRTLLLTQPKLTRSSLCMGGGALCSTTFGRCRFSAFLSTLHAPLPVNSQYTIYCETFHSLTVEYQ